MRELRTRLLDAFPICTAERLDAYMRTDFVELLEKDAFIYLEPLDAQDYAVPIISMRFDDRSEVPTASYRLGLFRFTKSRSVPEAIGYRFESPEDQVGPHSYYHIQRISSYGQGAKKALPIVKDAWTPVTQPAFPVDTNNVVGLLVCMIVSLYGRTVMQRLTGAPFLNQVAAYLAASSFYP